MKQSLARKTTYGRVDSARAAERLTMSGGRKPPSWLAAVLSMEVLGVAAQPLKRRREESQCIAKDWQTVAHQVVFRFPIEDALQTPARL